MPDRNICLDAFALTHGFTDAIISGNLINNCIEAGIRVVDVADCTVAGNICRDNGLISVSSGIEVFGPASVNAVVIDNKCYNKAGNTQDYGIYIGTGVPNAMLRDNFVLNSSAVVSGIGNFGTASDLIGNKSSLEVPSDGGAVKIVLVYTPLTGRIALSDGGEVVLSWNSVIGTRYQVQYRSNVMESGWTNLGETMEASAVIMEVIDQLGDVRERYYRIIEVD